MRRWIYDTAKTDVALIRSYLEGQIKKGEEIPHDTFMLLCAIMKLSLFVDMVGKEVDLID